MLFETCMQPKVIVGSKRSKSSFAPTRFPEYTEVLVDRTTIFGNPHKAENFEHRSNCLAAHEVHTDLSIGKKGKLAKALQKLLNRARKGEKLILVCWCKPKSCHADYYAEILNARLNDGHNICNI